ncbi:MULTISPECIES: hypothetical protein [Bifidobacterium]|nr:MULTISPECIES: hypothetical protein [Bifidobacterium]
MRILEDINTVLSIIANLIAITTAITLLAKDDDEPPPKHRRD